LDLAGLKGSSLADAGGLVLGLVASAARAAAMHSSSSVIAVSWSSRRLASRPASMAL